MHPINYQLFSSYQFSSFPANHKNSISSSAMQSFMMDLVMYKGKLITKLLTSLCF